MAKIILYVRSDGGISICVPAPEGRMKDEQESEWIARIQAKDIPKDAINVLVVDDSEVPADRTFRNAWTLGGKGAEVDMPKARDIWRDHLRALRKPLLEQADIDSMRAFEAGAGSAEIVDRKNALRDVTKDVAIEAARTPDELKAAMPEILRG